MFFSLSFSHVHYRLKYYSSFLFASLSLTLPLSPSLSLSFSATRSTLTSLHSAVESQLGYSEEARIARSAAHVSVGRQRLLKKVSFLFLNEGSLLTFLNERRKKLSSTLVSFSSVTSSLSSSLSSASLSSQISRPRSISCGKKKHLHTKQDSGLTRRK